MTAKQLPVNYLDAPLGLNGSHLPTPPDEMAENMTDRLRSFAKKGEIAIPVQTPSWSSAE